MSVSIEALAMAGTDYVEWGMDIEEWEQEDLDFPPAYLLADEEGAEEGPSYIVNSIKSGSSISHFHSQSQIILLIIIFLGVISISDKKIMGKKFTEMLELNSL
ncbi:hypothetical protein PTKIN_Ptkin08bG0143900 [Pterospermum kingtungense]